jgi:hypothetical protein
MVIATIIPLYMIIVSDAAFAMQSVRMQQNLMKGTGQLSVSEYIIHRIVFV